ncbi:MAG: cyclic nucleotide-binding domain-containing protein [Acetatifactor sp.]|nr:cyclic nucleotide-binding domain-containing protein [Acetatifactor sp.]
MGEQRSVLRNLKAFSIFRNLSEEDLLELSKRMHEEHFGAGKYIIKEGTEGNTMYLLVNGVVDIMKTTVYGDQYVTASVSAKDEGVFGEMALIDQGRRSASVLTKTDCDTLWISKEDFQSFCRLYPTAGCELLFITSSNLVRKLRKENENLRLVYEALIEEIESC